MILRLLAALVFLGLAASPRAGALESTVATSPRAQVSLISEVDAVAPGGFRVALRMRMAPGWYTYWVNPGDAGAAPEMEFALPPGMRAGAIAWPAPERHLTGPIVSYGYENEVVLPVSITVTDPVANPASIKVHATWLVCERICVPEEANFELNLPVGAARPSAEAGLFAAADARMPRPSPWPATVSPEGVLAFAIPGLDPSQVREAWFAPLAWGQVEHSLQPALHATAAGFTLALKPGPEFKPAAGLHGVLILHDRAGGTTALALNATLGPSIGPGPGIGPNIALTGEAMLVWQMLAFAFAGGAILNLMPCVFPVLAIKATGLARLSGQQRVVALEQAAAYAAGVILTFLALACVLVAVRAAGTAVGWGFQFQSPIFVAGMALLLFAIGLNLSGVFHIGAGGVAGAGERYCRIDGAIGSFFTGLLAVLVATPCTAPFMGVAIAAALVAPPLVMVAVFVAMGVGFALPYVLISAIPALARRMPRPGAWLDLMKQVMAFPMYAAAVWLIWVVSLQAGSTGVLYTAGGMLLVGFALWAVNLAQTRAGALRQVAAGLAVAAGIGAIALLSTLTTAAPAASEPAADAGYERFSPARLAALRAEGRPVFVNMTAAWCVSCLVNERVALSQPAVRAAFIAGGITYMKGDWTRRDPEISDFLRALGRDGVPLYVWYPAGGGSPVILPAILTEQIVLAELTRSGT